MLQTLSRPQPGRQSLARHCRSPLSAVLPHQTRLYNIATMRDNAELPSNTNIFPLPLLESVCFQGLKIFRFYDTNKNLIFFLELAITT